MELTQLVSDTCPLPLDPLLELKVLNRGEGAKPLGVQVTISPSPERGAVKSDRPMQPLQIHPLHPQKHPHTQPPTASLCPAADQQDTGLALIM